MAISFGPATSDAQGGVYSIQSAAKRVKGASVIVRCTALDDAGTIVHAHGKKLHALWQSPAGHVHAVSADGFHHTNAAGAWVKTRVTKGTLFAVHGIDDDRVLVSGDHGAMFEVRGTQVTPVPNTLATDWFCAVAASGPDDVYAVGRNGLIHFDGVRWTEHTRIAGAHLGADGVVCVSRDEVYLTTHEGLHRGNVRTGWTRIAERKLQYLTRYRGEIVAASYAGGIVRLVGDQLEVLRDDLSVTHLDGAGRYLCVTGMAPALHVFDGTAWTDKAFA